MKRTKRIVAVTGTYTNRSGEEKKQYTTIGTLFERTDGSLAIKLDSVPVGWNGWASFYDLDEKKPTAHDKAKQDGYQPQPGTEDEIPF